MWTRDQLEAPSLAGLEFPWKSVEHQARSRGPGAEGPSRSPLEWRAVLGRPLKQEDKPTEGYGRLGGSHPFPQPSGSQGNSCSGPLASVTSEDLLPLERQPRTLLEIQAKPHGQVTGVPLHTLRCNPPCALYGLCAVHPPPALPTQACTKLLVPVHTCTLPTPPTLWQSTHLAYNHEHLCTPHTHPQPPITPRSLTGTHAPRTHVLTQATCFAGLPSARPDFEGRAQAGKGIRGREHRLTLSSEDTESPGSSSFLLRRGCPSLRSFTCAWEQTLCSAGPPAQSKSPRLPQTHRQARRGPGFCLCVLIRTFPVASWLCSHILSST